VRIGTLVVTARDGGPRGDGDDHRGRAQDVQCTAVHRHTAGPGHIHHGAGGDEPHQYAPAEGRARPESHGPAGSCHGQPEERSGDDAERGLGTGGGQLVHDRLERPQLVGPVPQPGEVGQEGPPQRALHDKRHAGRDHAGRDDGQEEDEPEPGVARPAVRRGRRPCAVR
jgi:hypothetical protein